MTKFKVGDRVRWTIDKNSWQNITLTGFSLGSWDGTDPEYGEGAFSEEALELIQSAIPTDIAERAIALVRVMANDDLHGTHYCTARAILADLEPASVDLLAAREIEAQICREADREDEAVRVERGEFDNRPGMKGVLAAIAKGRQLEREGK